MEQISNHYILILCGGTGPRLWPISRADNPKQFLKLFNNISLLEQTLLRSLKIVPKENIFLVSNKNYRLKVENIIDGLIPKNNVFFEPAKKNTAMAIIYAAAQIQKRNPRAILTIFPSDHFIDKPLKFKKDIENSLDIAQKTDKIITFGIKPNFPNPSFGYIVPGQKIGKYYLVDKFIEKPKLKKAQKLLKKKAFWNSGIYTFKISSLIGELDKKQPVYFKFYQEAVKEPYSLKNMEKIYKFCPNLSFDKAISQKSENLAVIPAKFYWNDVGEWKSIFKELRKNKPFVNLNPESKFLEVNSHNCIISSSSDKLIGLVDINNLAIIDTPDALLICNIAYDGSSRVRDIVKKIVKDKKLENYFLKSPKNE